MLHSLVRGVWSYGQIYKYVSSSLIVLYSLYFIDDDNTKFIMPLELKSGKYNATNLGHVAQLHSYQMMLRHMCYGDIDLGCLLYIGESVDIHSTTFARKEERGLIMLRNTLVNYLAQFDGAKDFIDGQYIDLPNVIDNKFTCTRCPQRLVCSVYLNQNVTMKDDLAAGHAMLSISTDATQHLVDMDLAYFHKWVNIWIKESSKPNKCELLSVNNNNNNLLSRFKLCCCFFFN